MTFRRSNKNNTQRGFTIIEVLVTITIIGILASMTIVVLNSAKGKARDARRKHDLNEIATALVLYHSKHGTWIENTSECGGSGAGSSGNGSGWFNVGHSQDSGYPKSIAQCLIDDGDMSTEVIDPTGGRITSGAANWQANNEYVYMKYNQDKSCSTDNLMHVYLFARLESQVSGDNTAINQLSNSPSPCNDLTSVDTNYGMNYYLQVQ